MIRMMLWLSVASCGYPRVTSWKFDSTVTESQKTYINKAVNTLNDRLGCELVRIDAQARTSISLDESNPKWMGDFSIQTGDIHMRNEDNEQFDNEYEHPQETATIRMFLHEVGHALGVQHSPEFYDLMFASFIIESAPISDIVWGRYIDSIKEQGNPCEGKTI